MTSIEFVVTLAISIMSIIVALFAFLITLKGNRLLMAIAKSIQELGRESGNEKKSKTQVNEPVKLRELRLKEQRENRKALELELRKRQQDWKRKKDVVNLIGWFLDRLENDDD